MEAVTRWGAYVGQRLGELERGEGDYTGLRRPSAGAVMSAREVAASVFRDDTPTPSVVPTESGAVAFLWRKNGIDAELDVNETAAGLWVRDRASGEAWDGKVADHRGCCVERLLDRLAVLASGDPQPPPGTLVRDDCGTEWRHDGDGGYWLREDNPGGDPESWAKIAGNYGPVTVLEMPQERKA